MHACTVGEEGREEVIDQSYGFVRQVNRCPVGCSCLSWMIDFFVVVVVVLVGGRENDWYGLYALCRIETRGYRHARYTPHIGGSDRLKKKLRSFVLEYQRQVSFATYNLFSFLPFPFPSLSLQPPTASQLCRNSPTAFTAS